MTKIFSERTFTAIGLIIVGFVGFIFGPLALGIGALFAVLFGIFCLVTKKYDVGVITIMIGLAVIFISKYVNAIIKFVAMGCIIIGIGLFIYSYFIEKAKPTDEPKKTGDDTAERK
jgi:hypothetical protein